MFKGDKAKTATYCIQQIEKFLGGLRAADANAKDYAEIHSGVLFLCEDPDFAAKLRIRWTTYNLLNSRTESQMDAILDVAPELIDGFFDVLRDYVEAEKGKPQ